MNGDVLSLASSEGVDKGKDPGGRGVAGVEGHKNMSACIKHGEREEKERKKEKNNNREK